MKPLPPTALLEPPLIFDIETDGLLDTVTKIHCGAIFDTATSTVHSYGPDDIEGLVSHLSGPRPICGHNISSFDIPVIQKLYPEFNPQLLPIDTLIWSHLAMPDVYNQTLKNPAWRRQVPKELLGSHSLRAWGYRLGELKGETPDATWQAYSPELLDYCRQDVMVTAALREFLSDHVSLKALELELQVACILRLQEAEGVPFDVSGAERLAVKLLGELDALNEQLQSIWPPWQNLKRTFVAKVNNRKLGHTKGDTVEVWETVVFNPGSNHHLHHVLARDYGWKPMVFTDKGLPKLDDDILRDLEKTYEPVKRVRQWRIAKKILAFISAGDNSWLAHVNSVTKRVHGRVSSCGAGTRRMTHNSPNLGQVPSSRAYLGKECRALFSAPEGYTLVGIDADQLELRTLSHFLAPYDGGKYAHAAIHGTKEDGTDIHSLNAKVFGTSRDTGKTVFYGSLYGAGREKKGRIVTGSYDRDRNMKQGYRIEQAMKRGLPALERLKDDILRIVKTRGYLLDLDGQPFRIRSQHSALNELNQRAGAILMKRAEVYLHNRLVELGVDFRWLLHVHDEWQLAVHPEHIGLLKKAVVEAFEFATDHYQMRCPITGGVQEGQDWSETH